MHRPARAPRPRGGQMPVTIPVRSLPRASGKYLVGTGPVKSLRSLRDGLAATLDSPATS
jgi:hypothetical protein